MSDDVFGFGTPAGGDLVKNPFAVFEDKADPTVPTATLQIYQYVAEYLERSKVETYVQRGSAATQCPKRRQYQRQGVPGEALTPRKIINFLLGDLVEKTTIFFISQGCVGPGKLYSEVNFGQEIGSFKFNDKVIRMFKQPDLTLKVPGGPLVTVHPDGFGKRNVDGKWEIISVKSAADWGFRSFREHGAGDYLRQSHAEMMTEEAKALGVESVRYFYMRKQTGHLWDRVHPFDIRIAQQVLAEYVQVESDVVIPAPHGLLDEMVRKKPTGRRVAQFPCTYCPYLERCQGKHEVEWKSDQNGHGKPVYVFGGTK